ncbi:MAG: DUF1573 domain-containing protein [Gemmatales bacterium]|nr:DUF1573 domain-containing protein [Gemmatales bacterium]
MLPTCPLDLGTGVPGETLRARVPVHNLGNHPLVIESIKATCGGCSSLRLEKTVIEPGESVDLEIEAYLREERKEVRFQIRIQSNDPSLPIAAYEVYARVLPILEATPEEIWFGQLTAGGQRKEILIRWPDGRQINAPQDIEVSAVRGLVRVVEVRTVEQPMSALAISVEPEPDLEPGEFVDRLLIRPRGSSRELVVPVSGYIASRISVSPSELYLGVVTLGGTPMKRSVLVRRTDGDPLPAPTQVLTPNGVKVTELTQDHLCTQTRRFLVTIDPASVAPELDDHVVLDFGDLGQTRIHIVGVVRR